jgi:hypothetical protein
MNITRQEIIKILPFDEELKQKLLTEWDTFSEDQHLNIEDIIWDTYADLYQARYDMNTEIALEELSQGMESVDSKFAQRIRDKTDDEFEQLFEHGIPATDLLETREKLQDLMQNVVTTDNATPPEENNNASSN